MFNFFYPRRKNFILNFRLWILDEGIVSIYTIVIDNSSYQQFKHSTFIYPRRGEFNIQNFFFF